MRDQNHKRDAVHQAPASLRDGVAAGGDVLALRALHRREIFGEGLRAHHRERLLEELQADEAGGAGDKVCCVLGAEQLLHRRQQRADVFHGVGALDLAQALVGPAGAGELRRGGGIEFRYALARREADALVLRDVAVVFDVIAFEARIAFDGLPGADETKPRVLERYAVVAVPAVQHRFVDLARHGADRGPLPDPARRRIAHPGLARALGDVLCLHPAQRVREIMILRTRHGIRQPVEPELLQTGKNLLQMLAAEMREDEAPRVLGAFAADKRQHETRHQRVVEPGHGLVARDIASHACSFAFRGMVPRSRERT